MYNVFINTHPLNTFAESLKNIQPEKPLELRVDLISLLASGMKHGDYYCAVVLLYGFISIYLKTAKEMVEGRMTFMKVTVLQAIAVNQFGLNNATTIKIHPCIFTILNFSLYSVESDTVAFRNHIYTETAAQIKPAQESSIVSFEDSNTDCR